VSGAPNVPGTSEARDGEEALRFESARVLETAVRDLRDAAAVIESIVANMVSGEFGPHPSRPDTPAGDAVRDALSVYRRMDVLSWIEAALGSAMEADHERARISGTPGPRNRSDRPHRPRGWGIPDNQQ
jgi:hypothetical protein